MSAKKMAGRPNSYPSARKRTVIAMLCGLAGGALASTFSPWQSTVLLSWDSAAVVFMSGVFRVVIGSDSSTTCELSGREDNSRVGADLLLVGASVASLVAVLLTLVKASNAQGSAKLMLTLVAVVSVVLSWAMVHTIFMLHYAHLYYRGPHGGADFHDDADPDFVDFSYLAFTIGMTYQVSDTELTSAEMRRAALRHALLSYVFGTMIIATLINLIAGAIG